MTFAFFLFYVFSVIGLTHIMVDSTIMQPLREIIMGNDKNWLCNKISKILSCYQCAGTWCGFICGALLLANWSVLWQSVIITIMSGFAGSFLANLGAWLLTYLEAKSEIEIVEKKVENK